MGVIGHIGADLSIEGGSSIILWRRPLGGFIIVGSIDRAVHLLP